MFFWPLNWITLDKTGFPPVLSVTWYHCTAAAALKTPVKPVPVFSPCWVITQTFPVHVTIPNVWFVENIILTSVGATPAGKPCVFPLIVNFWKVVEEVIFACSISPSADQAYKPSVAKTIPWAADEPVEPKCAFKTFPVSAGKFALLIIIGVKMSATPSLPISCPQVL